MTASHPFELVTTAPTDATVTIDASIRSTADLLATLAPALRFPADARPTWDALVDRLSDASWQAGTEVFIDHASLPSLSDSDLRTYLGYLSDAFARRSIECAGLRVTFRAADWPRVEHLRDNHGREFARNPPSTLAAIEAVERHLGRELPAPYREFLLRSNGGEGFAGNLYLQLWRVEDLIEHNEGGEVAESAPGFFAFGSDGGGEAYVFDLTRSDLRVYMLPWIGMEPDAAKPVMFPFAEI